MTQATALPNDYPNEPQLKNLKISFKVFPRWVLLVMIRAYQKVISPALPADSCRFYPSCSHYGYQAIYKHGAIKGSWMTIKRIFRCNPWNPGGFDPVP